MEWREAKEQPGWSKDGRYQAFTIEEVSAPPPHPAPDLMSPAERVVAPWDPAWWGCKLTAEQIAERNAPQPTAPSVLAENLPPADDHLSEAELCEIEASVSSMSVETFLAESGDDQCEMQAELLRLADIEACIPSLIDEIRRQREDILDLRDAMAGMHRTMHSHLGKDCP